LYWSNTPVAEPVEATADDVVLVNVDVDVDVDVLVIVVVIEIVVVNAAATRFVSVVDPVSVSVVSLRRTGRSRPLTQDRRLRVRRTQGCSLCSHFSFGKAPPLTSSHAPAVFGSSKANFGPTLRKDRAHERSRIFVPPPLRRVPPRN
jgi:hypothetical protein